MRWLPAALLALLLAPAALAQVTTDPVAFVVYRPWPAPRAGSADADSEASALAAPPFAVERLPHTLVDRAQQADRAPESQPESALAHYRELSRLVQAREATGAPFALTLGGALSPGALEVSVTPSAAANVTLVVVEHARTPYAARLVLAPVELAANATSRQRVALDPSWDVERLGIVAIARAGEAVQSATWMLAQDEPTVQARKAVLVEHVSASWCDPCRPVDEALALLATQRAVAGGPLVEETTGYLRAPGWPLLLGVAVGGAAAVALLRRREP